jgi:hypothetical protein
MVEGTGVIGTFDKSEATCYANRCSAEYMLNEITHKFGTEIGDWKVAIL